MRGKSARPLVADPRDSNDLALTVRRSSRAIRIVFCHSLSASATRRPSASWRSKPPARTEALAARHRSNRVSSSRPSRRSRRFHSCRRRNHYFRRASAVNASSVMPDERETGIARTPVIGQKCVTTPARALAQRILSRRLGDTRDVAPIVLDRPFDGAIRTTQRPEIGGVVSFPKRRMHRSIARRRKFPSAILAR